MEQAVFTQSWRLLVSDFVISFYSDITGLDTVVWFRIIRSRHVKQKPFRRRFLEIRTQGQLAGIRVKANTRY